MTDLQLKMPVDLRAEVARECARILAIAERDAAALRTSGQGKRADELLSDREALVETMRRAFKHAPRRR